MQEGLLLEERLLRFHVVLVGHTAVYGADFGALRLVVEAFAFRAFIGDDVVKVKAHRLLGFACFGLHAGGRNEGAFEGRSVAKTPFHSAFVDGVVGAFGLASPAIDAFVGNPDSHECVCTFAQRYSPPHG